MNSTKETEKQENMNEQRPAVSITAANSVHSTSPYVSPSAADDVFAARMRIEDLFLYWMSLPKTQTIVHRMIEDVHAGRSIEIPTVTLSSSRSTLMSPRGATSSATSLGTGNIAINKTPPLSPTKSSTKKTGFSPEVPSPAALPQHFTFSGSTSNSPRNTTEDIHEKPSPSQSPRMEGLAERRPEMDSPSSMQSPRQHQVNESGVAGAHISPSLPHPHTLTPRMRGHHRHSSTGSAFMSDSKSESKEGVHIDSHHIPTFYFPGEGGRGRGRPMPGEALEDKLPLILDVWRRSVNSMSTDSQKRSSLTGANDLIDVVGVRIPRKDAMFGLPVEQFAAISKTLCGFPSFFAAPLFRRVRNQFGTRILDSQGRAVNPSSHGVDAPTSAGLKAYTRPVPAASMPLSPNQSPEIEVCYEHKSLPLNISSHWYSAPAPPADAAIGHIPKGYSCPCREDDVHLNEVDGRDSSGTIQLFSFLHYWRHEMEPYDHLDRFFRLIAQRNAHSKETQRRSIVPVDFMAFIEELLAFHPGLSFLESTPEFQEKYARTVIARIFYMLDHDAQQVLTLRQVRRSNLVSAFHTVDMEEDINVVNDYFSYEHFYVLYCKFWELDTDHDFFLAREDLNKVTDLTHTVLDRVFEQTGRRFTSSKPGKMGYEDFVCFLMSEEDKTTEASLRYWFNVVDINGDGVLTPDELRFFYKEQHARMVELGLEAVSFDDILTQMTDLLDPDVFGRFEWKDFIHPSRCKLTGVLFSILFSLSKFQAFEAREAVLVKQQLNMEGITQWDRFASFEYMRLAEQEEHGTECSEDLSSELEALHMEDQYEGGTSGRSMGDNSIEGFNDSPEFDSISSTTYNNQMR